MSQDDKQQDAYAIPFVVMTDNERETLGWFKSLSHHEQNKVKEFLTAHAGN